MAHLIPSKERPIILIAGATGYVGGRLRKSLEEAGRHLRCMARWPESLRSRVGPDTEVIPADCLDRDSLPIALSGVHTAYYLIHSMGSKHDFEDQDRTAARNFGEAARSSGVRQIIYVGGLGDGRGQNLSPHLRSRQEVGNVLRGSGVSVTEFRASIVIGSGSLSFELIRTLVERLPIMICPKWVSTPAQPIAIEDLLGYLVAALDLPVEENRIFEIGGTDQVSYGGIMKEYAKQRGLRRLMISVPVLTPRLSSLWLGLVTPIYARIGRKLIDSLQNPTLVQDPSAISVFGIKARGLEEAIQRALSNEACELAETRWSDAFSSGGSRRNWGGTRFGTRIVDLREISVGVHPADAFRPIRLIGGSAGWYYGNTLWRIRGFLDLLLGGVGIRRGRRDPESIRVGDTLDFWRVDAIEPDKRLRLSAEMKLPGRAWLEFEVKESSQGSVIRQTVVFDPLGLWGLIYWYALYPVHHLIFSRMLRRIAAFAQQT